MGFRQRVGARREVAQSQLRLNPVACDGVGMCAHLAPGLITLDKWGFPLVSSAPLSGRTHAAAARAAAGCPRRALLLIRRPLSEGIQRNTMDAEPNHIV